MPMFTEGVYGPMVNSITSLDGSVIFKMIRNQDIQRLISSASDAKYNNTKYCWYLNDRLYFVDIDFPAVRVEGIFEDDISAFKCCYEDRCKRRQDQSLNIPDFILAEGIGNLLKEILGTQALPQLADPQHDNVSPLK